MAYFHTTVLDNQIKALPTTDTASGSIATFNTDLTENLVSVKCQIVAKQASGTPSPDNPLPIGVYDSLTLYHNDINMWDEQWELGDIDVTTGQPYSSNLKIRSKNFCSCSDDASYYFYCSNSEVFTQVLFYDDSFNYLGRVTSGVYASGYHNPFNPSDYVTGARYFKLAIGQSYGTTYNNDISINYPSTDTQYHAFNGAYIPFGQTVANGVLDINSGKLRVTHEIVTYDGSADESWGKSGNYYYTPVNALYQTPFAVIADRYKGISPTGYTSLHNFECAMSLILNYLNIRDDSGYATVNDFTTWLSNNNLTVVYELATPIEIQLDSITLQALLNENNVWCDTGDTEVKFLLTVGKKIS